MKLFGWNSTARRNPDANAHNDASANPSTQRSAAAPTNAASRRFSQLLTPQAPRAQRRSLDEKRASSTDKSGTSATTASSSATRPSPPQSPRPPSKTKGAKRAPAADGARAPENYEMVKRRVRINLAILERPLMTDTEIIVDVRYRSVKMVGSGSYGIVVSAIDDHSGNRVAIKKIFTAFSTARMARAVLREVRLLRHLRHPNIVHLLDIDVPRQYRAWDEVYIVTPLLKMDLRHALQSGAVKTAAQRKRIALCMLRALEHMHSLGLMHRDIKSRNVLIDDECNAQICDLGHARFYSRATPELLGRGIETPAERRGRNDEEPELSSHLTTMVQCAPELCLGGDYDAEVDIWAAGCVIAEMVHPHHEFLFDSTQRQAHVQEIVDVVGFPDDDIANVIPQAGQWYIRLLKKTKLNGRTRIGERLGAGADPVVVDLLEQMLKFSPKQRLTAAQAIAHPWFDEVRREAHTEKEAYDFRQSEPHRKASRSEMKNAVWEEVVAFHPEAPRLGVR